MGNKEQVTDEGIEKLSFEEAFAELEATVQRLEEGDLALEEAIALYERGMHLARHCDDTLDAAELQVQQLTMVSGESQQVGMFLEEEGK
jgi:exodeoxyribonuclease VII small subunit